MGWLNPAEVESTLIAHPAVQEAAVIAREDANHLIKPAAYIVIRQDFVGNDELARNLKDWVMEKIRVYKPPRWVEFLPELPKTAIGKFAAP